MKRRYPFGAAWIVVLLFGCSGSTPPVNLVGFPAAFKQGYTDGCDSAGASKERRDVSRYRTDAEYRQGWNDGYSACSRGR